MSDDDNVIQLKKDEPPALLIGPFVEYRVVVDGRVIPKLTGHYQGDEICLVVDGRFSASFPKEAARQAAWLIAQALAIASGYSHLGADTKDQPFAPKAMRILAKIDDGELEPEEGK